MICKACKKELPQGSLFCNYCGKKQTVPEKRKALKRANGTGTVYKLSGRRHKPWVAAKNKVVLGYFETKTAALEALSGVVRKTVDERYNMTFAEVFVEWKAEHYPTIKKSGIASYDRAYDIFAPLHDKKFRTLRTVDYQQVINQHWHKSHSTVDKYKQLITQMSTWAMREELISVNFASFVNIPSEVKKEKEPFTEAEIDLLIKDDSEVAKIILMLLGTGMRIGELFDLPLADYHESYCIGGEKTEAGRNRVIPIRPDFRCYFDYFASKATEDTLLSGYKGDRDIDNFRKRKFYPLLDKLGIKRKRQHDTRHTYASWAVKNGMQPEVLQKILGHAKFSTTAEIYVHADIDTLVSAVEQCDKK